MEKPKKILFFHQNTGRYLGTLDNRGNRRFWGDEHVQDAEDGTNYFNFFMPNNIPLAEKVVGRVRVLIPHEDIGWQEFIVHSSEDDGPNREVRTNGAEIDLNKLKIIEPDTDQSLTAFQYLQLITTGTIFEPGIVEFQGSRSIDRSRPRGGYDYLGMVGTAFNLEIRIRTQTKGGRITRRFVDLLERVGDDRSLTVEYGKDLVGFRKFVDSYAVVTSLYCQTPEREDGTRLFTTVTHAEAFQEWNWQGTHLTAVYEPESDDQEMTVEELREYGTKALNKLVASIFEYDVEAISLEHLFPHKKVRLGDRINVKNKDVKPAIYARARVLRVIRSISNPASKRYIIGEIREQSEEEVRKVFRELQAIYGVKMIRSEMAPLGETKTIWIKPKSPEEPLKPEVPHSFNTQTQQWEKMAPTDASEIGGLMMGQQYNGVSITPEEGLVVDRTDELVRAVVNATEGISMQARSDLAESFKKVFFVDDAGNLNMVGIMYGSSIILGGEDSGSLTILGEDGAPIAQLDENVRDMPDLTVGYLDAPNKVEYADFGDTPFIQCVAAEATSGVAEPSDGNTGENWGSPLQTVSEALRRIPRMFDGVAEIHLAYGQTFNEELFISGFAGKGTLIIRNSADTTRANVTGKAEIMNNSTFIEWRDLNLNSTDSYAGFKLRGSEGKIVNCRVNGAAGDTTFGINANSGSSFEMYNCSYFNCVTAVRASYGGFAYLEDNSGEVSGTAIQAYGGGRVAGQGTAPTGGAGNTAEIAGGDIRGTWNFPTPPSAPAPVKKTTKATFNSSTSSSGTWRADENKWDSTSYYGNYATQGSYSRYGPFFGAWFFSALPTGKKIKSMRLYVSRKAGGVNAAVNVSFRPHTNASRPSGNVSMQSTWHSVGIAVGESKWISLPSKFFAGFESGSYKGMAIGGSAYAKLGVSVKLEITYEEVA